MTVKYVESGKTEQTSEAVSSGDGFTGFEDTLVSTTSVIPNMPSNTMQTQALQALAASSALINRSYLAELETYAVQPFEPKTVALNNAGDIRIYRVERIVQENKQSALESATAAYTAMGAAGYTVFLLLDSDGEETRLFIGTRGQPGKSVGSTAGELLRQTFEGHFGGSALTQLSSDAANVQLSKIQDTSDSITAVTSVPALSTEEREHFSQGLERFIDAAEGKKYQALILAEPVATPNLNLVRAGYEQVATQLSPLQKRQLSYGVQENDSVGLSITQSLSESLGTSLGLTETRGVTTTSTTTTGTSTTVTDGTNESTSQKSTGAKIAGIAGSAGGMIGFAIGGPIGMAIGGAAGSLLSTVFDKSVTSGSSHSISTGTSESQSQGQSDSQSTAEYRTDSTTETKGTSDTQSLNKTAGTTRQLSIEENNKSIEQLLKKIDGHLERIDEAQTYGGWDAAAYFIGESSADTESLASIFLGLIRGRNSSHEDFALSTWKNSAKTDVANWLASLNHPRLKHPFKLDIPYLTPATLVSGKEMALLLGLPRHSTSTVSVLEAQAFGRRVQRLGAQGTVADTKAEKTLTLGRVRHLWKDMPQKIELDINQLASHVFVSGSTGAGKSNTVYSILDQIGKTEIKFLVIEPAKGEYKHVFGHRDDVRVLGTNPGYGELLRINPFAFPDGIHVLEHIDRLVEIFNVCWPMYAAMPAVLKAAVLRMYESSGWDVSNSTSPDGNGLFPTFDDLLETLKEVINESAYSQEVKSNYEGSLVTRVQSLTNGLNGQIFSSLEIDSPTLFDSNVIVDLSRVGSAETKSLLMGILIMRLSEYRMAAGGMNLPLRHVTVLEEAHNILRNNTEGGAEGANVAAKSVEMLTNAIAEMRTFGEGFIIADQSPHAVDIAAIRNTNTKIIMRLPDETDRRLLGKSAALKDEQLEEIARLPKGVAVVYQNDWLEPVLCHIEKFDGEEKPYVDNAPKTAVLNASRFNLEVLKFLLAKRIPSETADLTVIEEGLKTFPLPTRSRMRLREALESINQDAEPHLWREDYFSYLSALIVDVLGCRNLVKQEAAAALDYPDLHRRLLDLLPPQASPDLSLAACQCLMKDFSLQNENHLRIYAEWRELVTKGVI
ncbi:ATP-binding protein [Betaproteobacteria bacterium]|nr:ATP-binding protein [Betaproteobacteria bacterium]GHT98933.1 ATP-binding protein [Betaproteobacteria bacterium]GHU19627.1 ATP-binding protein [Betaproteobacteria bacterium]